MTGVLRVFDPKRAVRLPYLTTARRQVAANAAHLGPARVARLMKLFDLATRFAKGHVLAPPEGTPSFMDLRAADEAVLATARDEVWALFRELETAPDLDGIFRMMDVCGNAQMCFVSEGDIRCIHWEDEMYREIWAAEAAGS
jgi:hypothetical protein